MHSWKNSGQAIRTWPGLPYEISRVVCSRNHPLSLIYQSAGRLESDYNYQVVQLLKQLSDVFGAREVDYRSRQTQEMMVVGANARVFGSKIQATNAGRKGSLKMGGIDVKCLSMSPSELVAEHS